MFELIKVFRIKIYFLLLMAIKSSLATASDEAGF
jgi:hypothetical protein